MKLNTFKLTHNILLAVVTLLLMDPKAFFGQWFHEIAGLAICLFYILHKALNWTWIKVTTKKLLGKAPGKSKVNYVMDLLLLVGFTLIIISGMATSKLINFSFLGFDRDNMMIYKSMHTSISMLVLAIAGIHLGLHWNWVTARFKRSAKEETSC